MIPFSPPYISDDVIREVTKALRSGWITTGPRTQRLEEQLAQYTGAPSVLCVNAATSGMELMLHWFGVQPGDEVIVPAYTYCATANIVLHCGAKPVMVDVGKDFNISPEAVAQAITPRTKAIIPVDIAGWPCDYNALNDLANDASTKKQFTPANAVQKKLGRPLVLSDAAHSLGAHYQGKASGCCTDVSVFSFHAVKNLTTAEGGAICLNLPKSFDNTTLYKQLRVMALHGQSKDAFSKTSGSWEYDVREPGYKCNMPDVLAAIGLAQFRVYDDKLLPARKWIFDRYDNAFSKKTWAQLPLYHKGQTHGSCHVYPLRIRGITETQRNRIIQEIFAQEVAVNVHFKPLPLLTAYKSRGYRMEDYPAAYDNYSREITLPVYYGLEAEDVQKIITAVGKAVEKIVK